MSRPETNDWVRALAAHHVNDHSKPLPEKIAALGIGAPGFVFSTNHSHSYATQVADLIAPRVRYGVIEDPQDFDILTPKQKSIPLN